MAFLIETQCYEDYGYRVKAKGGRSIIVEQGYRSDAEAVAELIANEFEHVLSITEVDADYESEFVKSQKKYEMGDTIYLDPVVRRSRYGDYYLKRGYIVGTNFDSPLAGEFVGWVDNLNTGKCVLKIEGDVRTPITENA
jgi:hypothetical protein